MCTKYLKSSFFAVRWIFTKIFTLDDSTKESHFTVYNGNCGQFMISLVSIYVSF